MAQVLEFFQALNSLSPLAVIGLLAYVIYLLVKGKGNLPELKASQELIATNHLHDLPEMAETLKRMESMLQLMNVNLIYIRARINGRHE